LGEGPAEEPIPNNCAWEAFGYLKNISAAEAAAMAGMEQGELRSRLIFTPEPLMSSLGLVPREVHLLTNWDDVFARLEEVSADRFLLGIRWPPNSVPPGVSPSHLVVAEKKDGVVSIIDPSRNLKDAAAITMEHHEKTLVPIVQAVLVRVEEI
jgi:hypothetical protein